MYVVVNKFLVEKRYHKDFTKETKDVWIKSYGKSKGFVKTIIMKDKKNTFLTIDFWKSKRTADSFFAKNLQNLRKMSYVPKKYVERKSYKM